MKRKRTNARSKLLGALADTNTECAFCRIASSDLDSVRVFEDENTVAFLDHRPLFPGHCLLITRQHLRTITDLPPALLASVFANVRALAVAVQNAMSAEGTFIAINNIVSQSVPHFHVHIVPRRKGDGLHGFMWPRHKYSSAAEAEAVGKKIRDEIARLQSAENKS